MTALIASAAPSVTCDTVRADEGGSGPLFCAARLHGEFLRITGRGAKKTTRMTPSRRQMYRSAVTDGPGAVQMQNDLGERAGLAAMSGEAARAQGRSRHCLSGD
jgi:hypothetical protein